MATVARAASNCRSPGKNSITSLVDEFPKFWKCRFWTFFSPILSWIHHRKSPIYRWINSRAGLKPGTAKTLTNLGNDYYAVAVAHAGAEAAAYNENECLEECKENVRVAAGAGARALQEQVVQNVLGEPESRVKMGILAPPGPFWNRGGSRRGGCWGGDGSEVLD